MSAGVLTRRPARGATALRGGRLWRPTPYQVFGFLFWLVMSLAYWRIPLCCDAGQHAAVVERLRADLLRPRHPMADLPGAGSPYFSPYAVAQGVSARLTGLSGWETVRLAGPLNLLVLLTGIGRFVRMLTPRPWAPVLALAASTLLWGTERAWWSGSLGLMPLAGTLGDPPVFAVGLALWAWALTGRLARDTAGVRFVGPRGLPSLTGYAGLGLLYGLVLLVDPVTAAAALAGGAATAAGRQRGWGAAVAGRWALTAAAALATAACWPYFDAFTAMLHGGGAPRERPHEDLPGLFWLALPAGLPALWLRGRRAAREGGGPRAAWRDPLVLMFASACLVAAYGWCVGRPFCGGLLGLAPLPLQCALAVELAAPRPWPVRRRLLGAVAAATACTGFLAVQAGAVVPRSLDPVGFGQPPRWPSYAWAAPYIRPGEVVIADGRHAVRSITGHGPYLAAPPWPDPALDERERLRGLADVRAYLDDGSTRAGRAAVVRRHRVRWLLLTRRRRVPEEAVVVAWSERTGEVLARVGVPAATRTDAASRSPVVPRSPAATR
ncbi:hypothetical protein [Streptomyces sp. NPDC093094]|uniref:hypothetical protein n=1 Tax=Streptomyces sp. NPDC093094 TaxID=3366026 RepID=UPI0038032560